MRVRVRTSISRRLSVPLSRRCEDGVLGPSLGVYALLLNNVCEPSNTHGFVSTRRAIGELLLLLLLLRLADDLEGL